MADGGWTRSPIGASHEGGGATPRSVMNIGYIRTTASVDELRDEFAAFERLGCERIVVDNAPNINLRIGTLRAVIARLGAGDTLVVHSMAEIANSISELIQLIVEIDAGGVHLHALAERFDTRGEQGDVVLALLRQLHQVEDRLAQRRRDLIHLSSRRVGRPKALSGEDASRARDLIKQGLSVDEVAQRFRVSRATLYRYLDSKG